MMICNFSGVAFSIFGLNIHWYSLAYIVGILAAWKITIALIKQTDLRVSERDIEEFISYVVIGIILGGRLGHVLLYDFHYYYTHPLEIIQIWKGGMSFYGGFTGIVIASYLFCKSRKIQFLQFIDIWAISAPIGLFFGRIANLINGELLGKAANVPWAIVFKDGIPRHPSQIYEALLEGLLLFIIMLFSWKKQCYKQHGNLSGIFCSGYGLARFSAEFFRMPDSHFSQLLLDATSFNLNQYISIAMFVLGLFLIHKSKRYE